MAHDRLQRPLLVGPLVEVAGGDAQGEEGDHQVDEAPGDHAEPGQALEPVVLGDVAGDVFGLVHQVLAPGGGSAIAHEAGVPESAIGKRPVPGAMEPVGAAIRVAGPQGRSRAINPPPGRAGWLTTGRVGRRRDHRGLGVLGLVVLTASATALTWPRSAATAATATARKATGGPTDVRQLYLSDCSVCHGAEGRGTNRGPTLVGVGKASLDYQLSTGRMPLAPVGRAGDDPGNPLQPLPNRALADPAEPSKRHRPAYPPETIAALVDYTDRLTGGGGPDIPHLEEGDMAEGGSLFRLQCAACHAWAGDGGALLHVDAPSLRASTPTQVAEAIRLGPGQMPAFGVAALTDEQVSAVVAYIRHLDQARDVGGRPLWHLGPVSEGGVALMALAGLMFFLRWIGERG